MNPSEVRKHLDEHVKIKLQENMTYKWNSEIKKVKTYLSTVKRIGQRFVIKDTVNRKVGSGRPRASTIKHHHRLKMTVLKENFC